MKNEHLSLLNLKEVSSLTRLSKPTIYKMVKVGKFPSQVRLGTNRVAWLETEVAEWIQCRVEARAS